MSAISINLLPAEFKIDQKTQKKFQLVQRISIAILLFLIFLASASSALKILQAQDISKLRKEATVQEDRITSFKDKEVALVVLKNRLSAINQIIKSGSDNGAVYKQVSALIPPEVVITAVSVNRSGDVSMSIIAPDLLALERVLSDLTSARAFKAISKIELESLSRGRDSVFRSNLKISAR